MHIKLEFTSSSGILELPIHHQHLLQGLVYHLMGSELSTFVHGTGFQVENRALRLFAFSRLVGRYRIQGQSIFFDDPVGLVVASPIDALAQQWASSLTSNDKVRLGDNLMELSRVEIGWPKVLQNSVCIRTLSPITAYSTLYRYDGSPYTCYFEPGETDFSELVSQNLKRKAQALGIDYPEDADVTIKPVTKSKMSIIKYKGGVIKGYSGRFEVNGPVPLLQVGLDAGFGSKNSQGFGLCVLETCGNKSRD